MNENIQIQCNAKIIKASERKKIEKIRVKHEKAEKFTEFMKKVMHQVKNTRFEQK